MQPKHLWQYIHHGVKGQYWDMEEYVIPGVQLRSFNLTARIQDEPQCKYNV